MYQHTPPTINKQKVHTHNRENTFYYAILPTMKRRGFGGSGREKPRSFSEKKEKLKLNPEGLKNLDTLLKKAANYFESSLGIGMDVDGKVSMDWFTETGYYTKEEVEQDKEKVMEMEEKFARSNETKTPEQKNIDKIAETFEKAVSVIFHYALKAKKKLSIVPTARHTDIFDGVDSFIVDEDGQVICAIDETTSNRDNIIQGSKLDNALKRNREKEETIKYGIALNQKEKKWYPSQLKREDAPLAYLSMPREEIVEFIANLAKVDVDYDEDIEELCDDLFTKLINSLYQSLRHVMTNMPEEEERERMEDLINLLQQKTKIDPPARDLP